MKRFFLFLFCIQMWCPVVRANDDFQLRDFSNLLAIPVFKSQLEDVVNPNYLNITQLELPAELIKQLASIIIEDLEEESLETSKLVSYRLVACREVKNDLDCNRPELRLIFQSLVPDSRSGFIKTKDEAIHLFFELTRKDFKSSVSEFKNFRLENKNDKEDRDLLIPDQNYLTSVDDRRFKFNQEYGTKLNGIVKNIISKGTLYKATFLKTFETIEPDPMTFQENQTLKWVLGGFDIKGNNVTSLNLINGSLPESYAGIQLLVQTATSYNGAMINAFGLEDQFSFLKNTKDFVAELVEDPIGTYQNLLTLENSKVSHSGNSSCISCHMAPGSILSTERKLISTKTEYEYLKSFTNVKREFETFNNVENEITTFHMFSYLFLKPVISQRVINDTAKTRDYFFKHYLN